MTALLETMLNDVKKRCGISEPVKAYDGDIECYLLDCELDMRASGVTEEVIASEERRHQIMTAATLYVKAYLGNDRSDTEKYLNLYRNKVFRLTLEGDDGIVE